MTTAARIALADALAQKAARLERCVARARSEHAASADFAHDHTRQDAAILNVQRACEIAIDMANMVIGHEGWGLPPSAREAFATLAAHWLIEPAHATGLQHMVGFRNVAVHQYEELNHQIVVAVIRTQLDALLSLAGTLLAHYQSASTAAHE